MLIPYGYENELTPEQEDLMLKAILRRERRQRVNESRSKTVRIRRKQRNEARKLRDIIYYIYGNLCHYCQTEVAVSIDHVIPLSKGGTNDIWNLRPACFRCNSWKADKLPWELF